MIVTNDAGRAERLKCLRAHGSKPKYHHKIVGGNFRLDALQAAIVTAKLRHLDEWTSGRQRNAKIYDQLFLEAGLSTTSNKSPHVGLPSVVTDRHIFNQYVIRVSQRDELQAALKQRGIGTEVYYPISMHLQECFAFLGHGLGAYPESEGAAKETLALPIYPELTEAQLRYVVESIREYCTTSADGTSASRGATSELIGVQPRH
jgi:dTDP-4-amino-4,6-dideoxygalactose transaminase